MPIDEKKSPPVADTNTGETRRLNARQSGNVTAWHPRGVPFCWQPKDALKRIELEVSPADAASAKLVYYALTRIASDTESSSFQVSIEEVAKYASVTRRTVERRLPDLERIGLIVVERSAMRTHHRYTLVTTSSRSDTTQSPSVATQLGLNVATLDKEKKEEVEREDATSSRNESPVEPPKGFPQSGDEAATHADFVGCPQDFAHSTWAKAMSRGGRDAKDIPIRSWRHYLATEWSYQQQRRHRGSHTTKNFEPDHTKGF